MLEEIAAILRPKKLRVRKRAQPIVDLDQVVERYLTQQQEISGAKVIALHERIAAVRKEHHDEE